MAKMTKKLVRAIWDSTSRCYTRALKEEYPSVFKKVTIKDLNTPDFDREMREILLNKNLPTRSHAIHEKYLKYIKKELTDTELSLVIDAAKQEAIKRDGTTIHACIDELFERSANSETKEKHGSKSPVAKNKRSVRSPKRRNNSVRSPKRNNVSRFSI